MENKSHALIAGVFTVILALAVLLTASWLNRDTSVRTPYVLTTNGSIAGLNVQAAVKYRGIPIGKVTKITYDPKNLSRVKVILRLDGDFPLKRDMVAEAGMLGITGLKYVEIQGGSDTAVLLHENDTIASRQSMFANISGKTESIVAKFEILLNHLNDITNPDSIRDIRKILSNVEHVTATADTFTGKMSPQIITMAKTFNNTANRLDSITTDIHDMTATLKTGMDAQKMITLLNRVDSAAISLKSLSQTLDLSIRQSREDFSVSMQNLRETLENANELSKMLTENPSLILKNENPKDRGQ